MDGPATTRPASPTGSATDGPPPPSVPPPATATGPVEPPPPPPVALTQALTRAQIDVLWDTYWASHGSRSGGTGGGPTPDLDPNDLFLQVSNRGVVCSLPTVELPCGGHWSATFVLPPALQQVGVHDLQSSALSQYSSMSESGPLYSADPNDCGHGAGSLGPGSLEVLTIDATQVRFRLQLESPFFDTDPSSVYTALRCPQ